MNNYFYTYKKFDHPAGASFSGANTGRGFVSGYKEIFDEERITKVYIIKGSSGCGKSSKMKILASEGEKNGFVSEYFFCGSDPTSLDCVKISSGGKSVIVLDGTSPHSVEARYPGLKSHILDFGVFLNGELLENKENELFFLQEGKRKAYEKAYKCLKWSDSATAEIRSLIEGKFDFNKANAAIGRQLHKIKPESGPVIEILNHAVTMKGSAYFGFGDIKYSTVYSVEGKRDVSVCFLNLLRKSCEKHNFFARAYVSPINFNDTFALELPSSGVIFILSEFTEGVKIDKQINTERFFSRESSAECRLSMRFYRKIRDSVFTDALSSLELASKYHFRLEEIYGSAMDFDALNDYISSIRNQIFSILS